MLHMPQQESDEIDKFNGHVDEIVGYAVPALAPSPKGEMEGMSEARESLSNEERIRGNSDVLCRGISENWKMIPDPKNSDQYIICNASRKWRV